MSKEAALSTSLLTFFTLWFMQINHYFSKSHPNRPSIGSCSKLLLLLQKKLTAPIIVDRVLEYIPELEIEIEKLTLKKNSMQSIQREELPNKKTLPSEFQAPTVAVNEVRKGELILQICMQSDRDDVFSNLIRKVEDEGNCITSSSSLYVCDDRVCYHLHIQVCFLLVFSRSSASFLR